ncbi:MAG: Fur family transcriptional regulator [Candidatus Promineifilaceae bacterium]
MSHDQLDLAALLHHEGYRLTPQRQMVLDAVCEVHGHATAEQIYELVQKKSEAVNRATIYRTLKFLRDMDLVISTTLPEGGVEYELAGSKPHHHLLCHVCGTDIEISDDIFSELVDTVFETYEFEVDTTHLTLYGICAACKEESS